MKKTAAHYQMNSTPHQQWTGTPRVAAWRWVENPTGPEQCTPRFHCQPQVLSPTWGKGSRAKRAALL